MALVPRPGVHGTSVDQLKNPKSPFQQTLARLNPNLYFISFLARDDDFTAFRTARRIADQLGFEIGWEVLGTTESIKFGQGGKVPGIE